MTLLNKETLRANIDARMADDQADGRVGGAGICVMQHGEEIYKAYFGLKSCESGEPMGDKTAGDRVMFRLASMTKPITAAAALLEVERGRLALDAPISRWLPAFSEMNLAEMEGDARVRHAGKATTPLTLRRLLNHTSGLGAGVMGAIQAEGATAVQRQRLSSIVDFWATTALEYEPSTAEAYSPVAAFDVAARLVELAADMPYAEYLQQYIFAPCGMMDTTFSPTEEQWARMVTMHDRAERQDSDGRCVGVSVDAPVTAGCVFEDYPTGWTCGGAGLASTLPDYARFAEMLRCGGVTADGERVLREDTVRAMGTPTVSETIMPGFQQWGLGVRVISQGGYVLPCGCYGWSGAYGTHFWVDPVHGITAVYMKNSRYDGGAGARTAYFFEQDVYAAL